MPARSVRGNRMTNGIASKNRPGMCCATVTWAFVGSLVLSWGPTARAQVAEDTGAVALQEVTVTAQRKEENLQKVPLTVQVISSEDLLTQHVTDPGQIQFLSPSVQLTSFDAAPGSSNFS